MLPILYKELLLKVPVDFSSLQTFENLLDPSGDGLQFTTSITISTQWAPVERDDDDYDADVALENENSQFFLPMQSVSHALNIYIRQLIKHVPQNHLQHLV